MQTPAVCPSAKQHGQLEVQNSWHCSLALFPLPFPPSHTLIKGFAGTSSNLGPRWTLDRKHSILMSLFSTEPGHALPQTPLQRDKRLSNREQAGARFKGSSVLPAAEMLRQMHSEEAINCFTKVQQTKYVYVKKYWSVVRGFNQTIRALGRSKCILPHFLIQLLIFVTRHWHWEDYYLCVNYLCFILWKIL